jgi:hypothetical protein
LVELLAVIAIMAIMTTYAVISVTRLMKAREVTTGSHILVSTMKYAQQVAIVRGVRTRVTFLPFKNVSGISLSYLTNAVRVYYVDTMLSRELHKDGWMLDGSYFEPRMLGQNVSLIHEGPSGLMSQYLLYTDNGNLTESFMYDNVWSGLYKTKNGTNATANRAIAWLKDHGGSGPAIGWPNHPYVEFDPMGRATATATCTVISVSSTNVGIAFSPGYGGTKLGNLVKVILNRGETRIVVE